MLDPAATPRLVCSLARVSRAHPEERKLLLARTLLTAHELLDSLAERGVPVDGWTPSTVRNLAYQLVTGELAAAGVRLADDLDEAALLDAALDVALAELGDPRFDALAEGAGFRNATHEAVRTLRVAGVSPEALVTVELVDGARQRLLARTLAEYEARLRSARLADLTEVLRRASAAVDEGELAGAERVYLVPGIRMRGWTGRLLESLRARGAELLATDPTVGIEPEGSILWRADAPAHPLSWLHAPPHGLPAGIPDIFAAASPCDELREVLRRVVALGLPWNQVEIVSADPSYPSLLDGLARRLGIPVRYATGLPAIRTRPGRALAEQLAELEAQEGGSRTSPAAVAARAADFLAGLPSDPVQQQLLARAGRIAETLQRQCSGVAAVRSVRGRLGLHVTPPEDEPLSLLEGEGVLLSEIQHGGRSGRRATFVVGLGAELFPGAGIQDPLLPDEDRRRIGAALPETASGLPTSAERLAERRHALAATLAGLRGRVTLSYAAWNPGEARRTDPAAEVLQALRVREGDPALDYDALRKSLGGLCGAVPCDACLDAADVWLAALRGGGRPVDGTMQLRDAFPALAAGLRAREALASPEPTSHHGVVSPQPERWDPRRNPELIVSASRLASLGRCPHQYLLRYVLRARVPEGDAGPDAWLAANQRGSLLHDVFDRTLKTARERGISSTDDRLVELAFATLEAAARELRAIIPPPAEMVFLREMDELRRDLKVWLASLDEPGVEWIELELEFGPEKPNPPVPVTLPGGTFRIRGAIDRVDSLPGGTLRIVDYKTGGTTRYGRKSGVFDGGRRLQHFVYTHAAEALLGSPVARMEYRFPTTRGENAFRKFDRRELEAGAELLDGLLDLVARGHFLPTQQQDDCRFCDYQSVCRVRCNEHGEVVASPLAGWAAEHAAELEAYAPLRRAREVDG